LIKQPILLLPKTLMFKEKKNQSVTSHTMGFFCSSGKNSVISPVHHWDLQQF